MFRQTFKAIFIGLAALDVARERLEQCLDIVMTKAVGAESKEAEKLDVLRERIKETIVDTSNKVVHRSEMLESRFNDKLRRKVADLSLDALSDSNEINELRAEIASLRAELVQLRRPSTSKVEVS